MEQQYRNHRRYYAPHHFIFLPLVGAMTGIGLAKALRPSDQQLWWGLFSLLSFCFLYLALMLRQHYALGNQDRIVRLEFRLRYFELTGQSFLPLEKRLRFAQIKALRFAGDDELLPLLQQALDQDLAPDAIKKAIRHWQPDHMRV